MTLSEYLAYPFVRYALAAGILISLCSSLLGVTLVLKRFSFIGDGLSHVAFGAMAIAAALDLTSDMAVVMPITAMSAVLLLRTGRSTKLNGDASVAMVSVGTLALGYLAMNIFSKSPNISGDVCSSLFGSASILTLSSSDVWICAVMSAIVLGVFIFLYNKIFSITFDPIFSSASGIRTETYNTFIALITAIVIVLAMNIVGSLLTSALIIFPALSAMRIFKSFRSVVICSGILSVVSAATGMVISILVSAPVGSVIVGVDIVFFALFSLTGNLIRK